MHTGPYRDDGESREPSALPVSYGVIIDPVDPNRAFDGDVPAGNG